MNTKCVTTSGHDHFQHEEVVTDRQGWSVMGFLAPAAHGVIVRREQFSSFYV